MNPLAYIAMFAWIPVVLIMFATLGPRRAVLAAFIGGWLFLPMAGWSIHGLPNYTKTSATSLGVLLGVVLFDPVCWRMLRLRWLDLPMGIWCIAPLFASLSNDLGVYDGLSESLNQTVTWGVPYLIGRMYFSDLRGLRELALAIFIGGLLYVPFCLYEVRFSPQLHRVVYGFHQHSFAQTVRYGGYRPMVFMQHGLMVGMWMAMASLAGLWLGWTGAVRQIRRVPVMWLVGAVGLTAVLCKSTFAVLLMLVGAVVLAAVRWRQWRWPVAVLAAIPVLYMTARSQGLLSEELLVNTAMKVDEERAESLQMRLDQEALFSAKAWERPIFGWGGWRRAFPEQGGKAGRIVDSQWIIALGENGLVGLTALTAALLLPVWLFLWRSPAASWRHPVMAGLVVLAVQQTLYMIDNLLNAMVNPVFILAAGGVTGLVAALNPAMFRPQAAQPGPTVVAVKNRQVAGVGPPQDSNGRPWTPSGPD